VINHEVRRDQDREGQSVRRKIIRRSVKYLGLVIALAILFVPSIGFTGSVDRSIAAFGERDGLNISTVEER
jgi:hypothetical protein